MADYTRVLGQKVLKGERMIKGAGWRLVMQQKRAFIRTLLTTFNLGKRRIAIFSAPKGK